MKKPLIFACLILLLLAVAGCSQDFVDNPPHNTTQPPLSSTEKPPLQTAQIALITNADLAEAHAFQQAAWQGIQRFISRGETQQAAYYQSAEASTAAYLESIQLAIASGAEIIILPDENFSQAAYEAQALYPEISFVLIDSQPHSADFSQSEIARNTCAVSFAEQQAGFLAGYVAVQQGQRKLGYMGGLAVPGVIAYGCGFLQGADQAARDLGVQIEINYTYSGCITESANIQTWAGAWFANGTEIIFACAKGANASIIAAAESAGASVIGADYDHSALSSTIAFSTGKDIASAVYAILDDYAADEFPGGKNVQLDVSTESVGIYLDSVRLANFSEEEYLKLYLALIRNTYHVQRVTDPLYAVAGLVSEATTLRVE